MSRPFGAFLVRLGLPEDAPPAALEQSLTHSSYSAQHAGVPHYERLEFLGDAILKMAMADLLFIRFPGQAEGFMTQILTRVVSDATLARIAVEVDLAPLLRLGTGEEQTGGRSRVGTLASALEAVLAAVYISNGFDAVKALVARLWEGDIGRAEGEPGSENFKAQLQERTQQRLGVLPQYCVLTDTKKTPYEHVFVVEVAVDGETLAVGEGSTKRGAEQQAARAALEALNLMQKGKKP